MPLLYTKQGHTGILTLSRPEARNCWGQDYADGLIRYLDEAAEDDEVRSVILTGDEAGGAFSAGANLRDPKTHNTRSAEAFIKRVGRARNFPSNLVSDFPKPVIAAVNGYAIGIGCIVTFCCDLIVASERAEWRLPQVALGILPNYGGATRLARIVGKGLAMRVAMGFPLKADEAHRIGLACGKVGVHPSLDLHPQSPSRPAGPGVRMDNTRHRSRGCFGSSDHARVHAVCQAADDIAGDLVADMADERGNHEPGHRVAPGLPESYRDQADERQTYRRLKIQALVGRITTLAAVVAYLAAAVAKATLWPFAIFVAVPGVAFLLGWVVYRERNDGREQQVGH